MVVTPPARRGFRWSRRPWGVGGLGRLSRHGRHGRTGVGGRSGGLGGLLLLQRLGQASHLRQRRLEQARGPGRQRLQGTGHLGQQHLTRLEVGDPVDLGRGHRPAVEHATLDDEQRVRPGEVAQALGRLDRVTGDEGDRGRAEQQAVVDGDAGVGRGPLGQGVLDDRVRGVVAERAAQIGDLLDGQAAVLGDDGRGRVGEVLGDLGDRADLLRVRRRPGVGIGRHVLPPLVRSGWPGLLGLDSGNEKRPGAGRTGRQQPNRPTCAGRSGAPDAFGHVCARDDQRSSVDLPTTLRDPVGPGQIAYESMRRSVTAGSAGEAVSVPSARYRAAQP